MRKLILFAASGAGSGYAPVAPGTFGSGVGVGLYLLLFPLPFPALELAVVGVLVAGALGERVLLEIGVQLPKVD